jgi:hypothetical protein
MSDTTERVEVWIYGADKDDSQFGRLEIFTVGEPIVTDRERVLENALDAANDRIAELERMLTEVRADA